MLTEICAEIRNYFADDSEKYIGDFVIENGAFVPSRDFPTNYIRIVGSHLNDGVHVLDDENDVLQDESFHGGVWVMSPPKAFIDLAGEIAVWQAKNGKADSAAMSPFTSESFGGYSYSKSVSSSSDNSASVSWRSAFASRLNLWRKIRV